MSTLPAPAFAEVEKAARPPRKWLWWLFAVLLVLGVLLTAASLLLDPWLRRKLEEQVAERSEGRYKLRLEALHTSWWRRSVQLQGVHLLPGPATKFKGVGASWPQVQLDLDELFVSGIGVGALLRRGVMPINKLLLDAPRLRVLALPIATTNKSNKPLYAQLPFKLEGIRLGHLELRRVEVSYGAGPQPIAHLRRGDFTAKDILLSAAGAADTQRIGYAATIKARIAGVEATIYQHHLALATAAFSSKTHQLGLDSLRVEHLGGGKKGSMQVALKLPRATLSGLQTATLQRRQFRADSLYFAQPRVTFKPPAVPPPSLDKVLAPYLDRFQLAHVVVEQADLHVTGVSQNPTLRDVTLNGHQLRVDAVGAHDPARILYAQAWEARTGPSSLMLDAPYYRLTYQSMSLATRLGLLQLNGVLVRPTMSPAALNGRKHHQAPHVTAQLPYLRLQGFNYAALARNGSLLIQQGEIRQPRIKVAGDGRFPLNPKASIVTPDAIGRLPFRVDVRKLLITDCNMYFSYLGPSTGRVGTMSLNRMQGTLTNFTNDPRRMSAAHPAVARASGWLQNQCLVKASFWLPLLDRRGTHRIEGTFGPAPIAMLNSMTEPCRLVGFKQGQLQRASVRMQGDRRHIEGVMQAQYKDLQLTFLAKNGGLDRKNFLSKLKSKAVNVVMIRDENPRRRGTLKPGIVQSNRDLRLSVFSLWRQGVVSGMLNSIGVPQKMAQKFSEMQ